MQKVEGLTIHTTTKEIDIKDAGWRKRDFALSVLLILLVGVIWAYFQRLIKYFFIDGFCTWHFTSIKIKKGCSTSTLKNFYVILDLTKGFVTSDEFTYPSYLKALPSYPLLCSSFAL